MLFLDVPPFDLLTMQESPYTGFGEVEIFTSDIPTEFLQTLRQAQSRLSEVFGIDGDGGMRSVQMIKDAIDQMWIDGWNPRDANIDLFVTDFGCIIADVLRQALSGTLVLRSRSDLSHASIWWPDKMVEAFPLHATYKQLSRTDGESLVYFAASIESQLRSA